MRTPGPCGRRAACAAFLAVPAVLAGVWRARTPPSELGCGMLSTPARDAVLAAWRAGAGPILGASALVVLAAIAQVSWWRSAARGGDRAPLRTTLLIAGPLAVFVVACALDTGIFVPAGMAWSVLFVFWPVTAPALALGVGTWVRRQPPGERALAALQALGWCSLLLGITGVAVMIGGAGIAASIAEAGRRQTWSRGLPRAQRERRHRPHGVACRTTVAGRRWFDHPCRRDGLP